jgi:hypothetical protein
VLRDPDPSFHFDVDLDQTYYFDADPDPVLHPSDANLRLLVYRPSTDPFWASTPPLKASTALYGSTLSLHRSRILTLISIRIRNTVL